MVVTSGTAPDADHLRGAFTRFFTERGHAPVASASLIPHDPSVLFTIAGMVPFKPFFLGDEAPPWPRARPSRPQTVSSSDWLRYEHDKCRKLLASAAA